MKLFGQRIYVDDTGMAIQEMVPLNPDRDAVRGQILSIAGAPTYFQGVPNVAGDDGGSPGE